MVETEARSWREGKAVLQPRTELLQLAAWRASRPAWTPPCSTRLPAGQPEQDRIVVNMLLDHCRGRAGRRRGGRYRHGTANRAARARRWRDLPASRLPPVRPPLGGDRRRGPGHRIRLITRAGSRTDVRRSRAIPTRCGRAAFTPPHQSPSSTPTSSSQLSTDHDVVSRPLRCRRQQGDVRPRG
jgi:hypothetical protein